MLSEGEITYGIRAGLEVPSPHVDAFFGLDMELCTEELRSFYQRNPHVRAPSTVDETTD